MAMMASDDEVAFAEQYATNQRHKADGALRAQFYMGAVPNPEKSKEEKRPIFDDVPMVAIFIPGDKDNVNRRRVWDEPGNPNCDTARWPKQWADFQAGREQATSGTPISQLPGITEGQVRELAHFHVRTVEQMAAMSDEHAGKSMGFLALKQRAQAWLDAAAGNAPMEAMRAELEKRDAMLAEMQAQLAALAAAQAEPPKRGPGRPTKDS